jgi:hypothetical protein
MMVVLGEKEEIHQFTREAFTYAKPFIEEAVEAFAEALARRLRDEFGQAESTRGAASTKAELQRLVTVAALAKEVGQARSSLYRMAKLGVIPSYSAGPRLNGLRFDVEEVRRALRKAAVSHVAKGIR